jgi:hypothetical protein
LFDYGDRRRQFGFGEVFFYADITRQIFSKTAAE